MDEDGSLSFGTGNIVGVSLGTFSGRTLGAASGTFATVVGISIGTASGRTP